MCALRQWHMYTLGTRPGRTQPRYFVVEHSTVVEHDADAGWEIWLFECAGGCWRRWSLASSSSWVLRSGRSGGVAQDRRGTCRGGRDRGTDPSRGGRCRWRRRLLLHLHRLHLCSLARTHTSKSSSSSTTTTMSKTKFDKAVSIVQGLPKEGPIQPTQDEQLYVSGIPNVLALPPPERPY